MASKPASKKPTEPQKKSERTRALIVETALELFRAQGYEQTTMRKIAEAAGVSAGNAYYYFASKEELVQAFYDELQERHGKELKRVLPAESALADRLRVSLLAFQKVARPYHAFADKFFKVAASPHSPLSPFSPESAPARAASIALWREVVNDADDALDDELRHTLPSLLWLLHMGVVLFWVYDQSPQQARTKLLIERCVPMIDTLVQVARNPLVRPLRDQGLTLLRELAPELLAASPKS
jgi:AcrR family transcriptional regulator